MIKADELRNPDSCLRRADDHEMVFVLRAHDSAAPAVIRYWALVRVTSGKNQRTDPEIIEALACARMMDKQRRAGEV